MYYRVRVLVAQALRSEFRSLAPHIKNLGTYNPSIVRVRDMLASQLA